MSRAPLPMFGSPSAAPGVKVAEADDPVELVGVPVPVDEATFDEMAACLAEEYVRSGWSDADLLALFRSPFYAGMHVIYLRRGDRWVRDLLADVRRRWRRPDPGLATGEAG